MDYEKIEIWLAEYLKIPDLDNKGGVFEGNYIESGYIDSYGLIQMIADIEEHFNISFTQDHFEDRKFATVSGLARIIAILRQ